MPPTEGGLPTVLNSNREDSLTTNIDADQKAIKNSFLVYPNPSTGLLTLSVSGNWLIYSLATGKEILSGSGNKIDSKSAAKGFYLVTMNNDIKKLYYNNKTLPKNNYSLSSHFLK